MEKIKGFEISKHQDSKRIINIKILDEIIEKLIFPFHKFDVTALEYKPFTRFTLAKSLDDLTFNQLGKLINSILKDRETGCFIIETNTNNKKINDSFLVKLSTAITHLIGLPNHDSMDNRYYARFHVKHEDHSDSYLRKAYTNMDLHTDGTYVKEKTDWLLMTKLEEKNVDYKVEHPVFSDDKKGNLQISYIDQFPEPKNMEQGNFLQRLSDALEESKNKIITKLPSGSAVVANNYFWLHGRRPFKENKNLCRELLRIRGVFFKI